MPVTYEHTTLENGLTIIAEIDPDAHSAAGGFFVRTGARDETPELMGVSHFLEHMMFKGTDRRSADDINREFDEIGAKYNAYTSSEMTVFHGQTLPELFPRCLDLLSDMMRPALRDDDFNQERHVILEEIAMYKDNPFWVLYDEMNPRRYPDHPLGHLVLGTNDTITAMQRDQMRTYFDDRYSADNTVVSLAGRLDFEAAVKQIADLCGSWQNTGADRDTAEPAAPADTFELTSDRVSRGYTLSMSPAPAYADPRRHAAGLLAQALGGGGGNSRLHWALIEPGLADECEASYDPHDGGGNWFVYACCDPAKLAEVEGILDTEIAGLLDNVTDDDLARLRSKALTAATLAGERPGGRMQRLGRLWTYLGTRISLEDDLAALDAVTLDDVRAVYEAFPFAPRVTGRLMPQG